MRSIRLVLAVVCALAIVTVAAQPGAAAAVAPGVTAVTVDPGAADLTAVSCPTSTFCAAVDASGNAVTYDGSAWSAPTPVGGVSAFDAVSCSSATFCTAVGSSTNPDGSTAGAIAGYLGGHWHAIHRGRQGLAAVSCVNRSFCLAVSADGGYAVLSAGAWSGLMPRVGTAVADVYHVDCVSASFCATPVDVFDGTSWHPAGGRPAPSSSAISCPTAVRCVSEAHGFVYVDNGSGWRVTDEQTASSTGDALDCPTTAYCLGVADGGPLVQAIENGVVSQPTALAPGGSAFADVSCPTVARCWAVRRDQVVSWVTHVAPVITRAVSSHVTNGQAQLGVAGSGSPAPAITWQFRRDTGGFSGVAAGSPFTTSEAGDYRAVLSNSSGTVISRVLHVVFGAPITITAQPRGHGCVPRTITTVKAAVSANPAPSWQWQRSVDGARTWSVVANADRPTLTVVCAGPARYRALVQNYADRVYTRPVLLRPWTAPRVTARPADAGAVAGRTVTFTARASGRPAPTVAWQVSADRATWTNIGGATSATLTVVVTRGRAGRRYRAVFRNPVARVVTRAATLTLRR